MLTFQELGLSSRVLQAVNEMGFEETTPIQGQAIPVALEGKDLIGQAQTGTGKTAAFGIPMVERFEVDQEQIQGLVVTPTRELAIQVAEELYKIGQFKGIRALPIYGGQNIDRQIKALKKRPHIIVGTPGRLLDHIRRRTIRLQHIEVVVLDEADEMLNMGFIEDIEKILQETPTERQTLLFSATMPKSLQKVTQRFMKEPEIIGVKSKELTVPSTEQCYMEVSDNKKFDVLCRSLDIQSPELAIVFVRTKRRVDEIAEALKKRGYSAERIHGDLTQATRDYVMRHFREGTIDTLVATDVAARGLDISGVTHVYNFDIPQDPESYVHRIGRTGRIGHSGQAITFVTSRELHLLRVIESLIRMKIPRRAVPTSADAIAGQQHLIMEKLVQVAKSAETEKYRGFAEEMLEENDSVTLLSAALKMLTKEPESVPVKLTEDSSYRMKKKPNNRSKNKHYNYNRSAKVDSRPKRFKSRRGR
ncbi:MAG: DEAD/DEAH box helicase [Syntrophaceticus sp.]|nr:DEAD/DEAH box helicase [Syntrophaceticus sp.]MDD3314737.1 DEAD/DEAH box helicase [Syntrophaceticus sp.]MDD4360443.1 DEAD/DEAH box helicase [Syntrophaceticus sp.]MDD4782798.1 DEAD/DEAH box helicase [Syntrophaceticus sp.]